MPATQQGPRRYYIYKSDTLPTHNITDFPDCGTGIIFLYKNKSGFSRIPRLGCTTGRSRLLVHNAAQSAHAVDAAHPQPRGGGQRDGVWGDA